MENENAKKVFEIMFKNGTIIYFFSDLFNIEKVRKEAQETFLTDDIYVIGQVVSTG